MTDPQTEYSRYDAGSGFGQRKDLTSLKIEGVGWGRGRGVGREERDRRGGSDAFDTKLDTLLKSGNTCGYTFFCMDDLEASSIVVRIPRSTRGIGDMRLFALRSPRVRSILAPRTPVLSCG